MTEDQGAQVLTQLAALVAHQTELTSGLQHLAVSLDWALLLLGAVLFFNIVQALRRA